MGPGLEGWCTSAPVSIKYTNERGSIVSQRMHRWTVLNSYELEQQPTPKFLSLQVEFADKTDNFPKWKQDCYRILRGKGMISVLFATGEFEDKVWCVINNLKPIRQQIFQEGLVLLLTVLCVCVCVSLKYKPNRCTFCLINMSQCFADTKHTV